MPRPRRNFIGITLWRNSARSASPATMDIPVSSAYLSSMISRLITLLAILAITAVTTVGSAHAVGMGSGLSHTTHLTEIMHPTEVLELACDARHQCGPADAEMCEFVCASLSAFLTSPDGQAKHFHGSVNHDIPSDSFHVSRAPELNERPPELRLL